MNDNSHVVSRAVLATISSLFMSSVVFAAPDQISTFSQSSEYGLLGTSLTQSFQSERTVLQFKHS